VGEKTKKNKTVAATTGAVTLKNTSAKTTLRGMGEQKKRENL
jgi:hypothetical protein